MTDVSPDFLRLNLMRNFQLADETCIKRIGENDEAAMLAAFGELKTAYDAVDQSDHVSFRDKWAAVTAFSETSALVGMKRTKSPEEIRAHEEFVAQMYKLIKPA